MSALVPNRRGLDTALAAGMKEIAVFLSASETHNKKNVNKTIAETLAAFDDVVPVARAAGVPVRAYVSTVFGCPYEGDVDPERAVALTGQLRDMGVYQVSLGDTIGVANPRQVEDVLVAGAREASARGRSRCTSTTPRAPRSRTAWSACRWAITTIDAAAGGLGGCPYAPGASGNLATEDVVAMLHSMGVETGIDLDKLTEASRTAATFVGHELPVEVPQGAPRQAGARAPAGRAQQLIAGRCYGPRMSDPIVERRAAIVWITLNRPDARNALSRAVNLELGGARRRPRA